ncbi:MAG: glycosyltransferase family 4 protein [Lachnospiraceae bacterium]|nr:glycosyltransferase family 4 protein [Lachnospiraceae bacterium]
MNILIISHEYPPIGGGGANACYYLTKEYAKCGHRVTLVTSMYHNLPSEEVMNNVRIIRVKALRKKEEKSTFLEMFTYLCSAWCKIRKMIKIEHYDVCQIFFGIPSGPIGLYLKKKYKIPYVVRFGGGDIPGAQKRFSFIYKLLSPIIRSIWMNADALVANSEVLMQKALDFENRYPIDVITNGVDSDFYAKDRDELKAHIVGQSNRVNILFVSRLIQGKGLQYVIPYMREINEKCLKSVYLTIVGDGPYREELERITEETKTSEWVSFEGKKNKEELYFYYDQADLFILPSESEGMPNVVLEAMAMGLPIIMTPCGGSKELIQGNGYVVSIDNFVDKVINLCNDERSRISMGEYSKLLARTKFSWREKAEKYLEIFKRISG